MELIDCEFAVLLVGGLVFLEIFDILFIVLWSRAIVCESRLDRWEEFSLEVGGW